MDGPSGDLVLDRVFELMASRLITERTKRVRGVVHFRIATPSGYRSYRLAIDKGHAAVDRGVPRRSRVRLTMNVPTLLRLCAGSLHVPRALRDGALKVRGDVLFAARMQRWFER